MTPLSQTLEDSLFDNPTPEGMRRVLARLEISEQEAAAEFQRTMARAGELDRELDRIKRRIERAKTFLAGAGQVYGLTASQRKALREGATMESVAAEQRMRSEH